MSDKASEFAAIVVGAGTAGLACAITAAERGAKVLVIEKSARIGGTLHISGGQMSAAGTRRQRARNIEDSPAHHFADVMRISRNTANPMLVKLAVEEAAATLDWLDALGFPFVADTPKILFGHESYSRPRTVWGIENGVSIFKTLEPLWKKFAASEQITFLPEHTLIDLIEENSQIVGVWVRNKLEEKQYFAPHTILTTGGYASNSALFARVTPGNPRLISTADANARADGIALAIKHGAQFWNGEKHLGTLGGIETEPGSGRASWDGAWANVLTSVYRLPREIYINAEGQRFMAEDEPSPDVRERIVWRQPEQKFWIVFDSLALEQMRTEKAFLLRNCDYEYLISQIEREKFVWRAPTLKSLAEKIKVKAENLEQTVKEFNNSVDRQVDVEFNRKHLENSVSAAPFYALLTHATSLISFGGLAVNDKLQILDQQNNLINGLFAAGEAIGAGATSGNSFCSGMVITPALSFGRILGRSI